MTTNTPHNEALPVSTSDLTQEVQIRSSTQTQGQLPPKTIMEHFNASVEQYGNSPALHYKVSKVRGVWNVLCAVWCVVWISEER